jgi:predicted ester cyclase
MSTAAHETFIRDYIETVFNRHRLDDLSTYWVDDLASHWMGQQTLHGLDAWRAGMTDFFTAFPDLAYTLDDLIATDDRAVWRGRWRGTQHGEWAGIAASGKAASWTVIIIGRCADDGRFAEDWVEYDRLGLYRQLGAIPLAG